jgi:hypothetical protein
MTDLYFNRQAAELKHRGAWAEMVACCWLLQQGYEVFRNVSAFGGVDLVAIKAGDVSMFDVKGVSSTFVGVPALTEHQLALGVTVLAVYDDGRVVLCDRQASVRMVKKKLPIRCCALCQREFFPWRETNIYCTPSCSDTVKRRRRKARQKAVEANEISDGCFPAETASLNTAPF